MTSHESRPSADDAPRDSSGEPYDFRPRRAGHWLTRSLVLRALAANYAVAFVILIAQLRGLIGEHGLLPVSRHLRQLAQAAGGSWAGAWQRPSLFWLNSSDGFMLACAWLGLLGSLAVVAGVESGALIALLWLLYLSFVHVGQDFYGFGWEILLLEAGFLAIFLCSWRSWRPFPRTHPPPRAIIWLFRWLTFRVMFGAGLIKIRGDSCWRELTCLQSHYETQPNPHPLSWAWHQLPDALHAGGVLFNHFAELIAPFALFLPRPWRSYAGLTIVAFQLFLIFSGNLAFLNWLTIAIALAAFDDEALLRLLSTSRRERITQWLKRLPQQAQAHPRRRWLVIAVTVLIGALSLNPIMNMLSPAQAMNRSFERLHLVNTYGAFGSVGRVREEIIISGTSDTKLGPDTQWREYGFPCKPGDPRRRPCLVTPYHYRLDWQAWFVPLGPRDRALARHPWLIALLDKLLAGDRTVLSLLSDNPFALAPPRYVKIDIYRYHFTRPGEGGWWRRERVYKLVRPLSRDDAALRNALRQYGFEQAP